MPIGPVHIFAPGSESQPGHTKPFEDTTTSNI